MSSVEQRTINLVIGMTLFGLFAGVLVGFFAGIGDQKEKDKHILIGYQNGFEAGVKATMQARAENKDVVYTVPAERYTIISTTNVTKTVKKLP